MKLEAQQNPSESEMDPVTGHTVYWSDEFKALCKLLNIPHGLCTTAVTITIALDYFVTVTHGYYGSTKRLPKMPPAEEVKEWVPWTPRGQAGHIGDPPQGSVKPPPPPCPPPRTVEQSG